MLKCMSRIYIYLYTHAHVWAIREYLWKRFLWLSFNLMSNLSVSVCVCVCVCVLWKSNTVSVYNHCIRNVIRSSCSHQPTFCIEFHIMGCSGFSVATTLHVRKRLQSASQNYQWDALLGDHTLKIKDERRWSIQIYRNWTQIYLNIAQMELRIFCVRIHVNVYIYIYTYIYVGTYIYKIYLYSITET